MLRGLFSDPNGLGDLREQMGFTSGARIIWIWEKVAKQTIPLETTGSDTTLTLFTTTKTTHTPLDIIP